MTKPWVAVVAGACSLITIAIAARHLQSRGSDGRGAPARSDALVHAPIAEHGGWSVRHEPSGSVDIADGGPAPGGASSDERGYGATAGTATGGGAGGGPTRGGTTVISGGPRMGGSVGVSGSMAPWAGGTIQLPEIPDAAVRFERPGGLAGGGAGSEQTTTRAQSHGPAVPPPAGDNKAVDENGPVLSLTLDNSIQPEKGDAPVVAEGITFDSGAGAKFSTDSQLAVPNAGGITGEAGTVSFTIQGDWAGNDQTDASLVQLRTPNDWNNRIQITKNGQWLRFLLTPDSGIEAGAGVPINWQPGELHQVTTTWGADPVTGQNVASLYVDGRLAGQSTYQGTFVPPTGPLLIGSDFPGGQPGAQGTLGHFQAFNRALAPQEVTNLSW